MLLTFAGKAVLAVEGLPAIHSESESLEWSEASESVLRQSRHAEGYFCQCSEERSYQMSFSRALRRCNVSPDFEAHPWEHGLEVLADDVGI